MRVRVIRHVKLLEIRCFRVRTITLVNIMNILLCQVNQLGAIMLPLVNDLANWMTDFPTLDDDLQKGVNIYPGEQRCEGAGSRARRT